MPQWAMKNLKVGGRARMGQIATYMGTTGRSNGVHLHLGARLNNRFVDPEPILRDYGAWPLQNDYYKPKPAVVKPAQAPEPPKEWSDMASKEEIAEVVRAQFLDVLKNEKLIPWTDSETGEKKVFSVVDALKYGLPPQTTMAALEKVLTESKVVRWVDQNTKEDKRFSVADALYYGNSIQWNREHDRDVIHDSKTTARPDGGSTADDTQPAPDSAPIQTPEVPDAEAITPTAPTEGPSA